MSSETKTLTAACHCRNVQFNVTVSSSSLPLEVRMCHCRFCRYRNGAPYMILAEFPKNTQLDFIAPSSYEKLATYKHSDTSQWTKHFCGTCGCHIGDHGDIGDEWFISNAVFDSNCNEKGLWEYTVHWYPASAPGGMMNLIPSINGRKLDLIDPSLPTADEMNTDKKLLAEDKLQAQCHCGGVSFTIFRPSAEFIASPSSEGWISRSDPKKWLALIDVCTDCRLVNGAHAIGWMFVPKSHISPAPPSTLTIGTSKSYSSSADVLRTFCGTCGATVFYHCADRPEIVDVATGILRAPGDVMAEDWAIWRASRLAWSENGLQYDEDFTRSLMTGMKQWGIERGYTEDFVIP